MAKAEEWPFEWEAQIDGTTLRLSSRGEARAPYHRYLLEEVAITVPPGVQVQGEQQELATALPTPPEHR